MRNNGEIMDAKKITFDEFIDYIDTDRLSCRLIARIIFVNNLSEYLKLVAVLSEKADIVLHLSDAEFCKGEDTIPDMHSVIDFLDKHKDENILIPNLSEYMRIGNVVESKISSIYSLLNRHVHSSSRIWIPLFYAKELFDTLVGPLPEERFGDAIFELDCTQSEFAVFAYSTEFDNTGICNANGIRAWLKIWDNGKISSGMSFSTKLIKLLSPTLGGYNLNVISKPFDYIVASLKEVPSKLNESVGSTDNWSNLVTFVRSKISIRDLLLRALNVQSFDSSSIMRSWKIMPDFNKWVFWLWYKLGLCDTADYITYALSKASYYQEVPKCLEIAIFDTLESPNFDEWNKMRIEILKEFGNEHLSEDFWDKFDALTNARIKIKLLSSNTLDEQWRVVEIVSNILKNGESLVNYESLINNVCPALYIYLQASKNIENRALAKYINAYKRAKISNQFSFDLIHQAKNICKFDIDSRNTLLHKINNVNSYFLWIDGMGIEWIDLLVYYVNQIDPHFPAPSIWVGYAFIPTITKANMDKTSSTYVTQKINDLDELSHVKDKSDCNYYVIIAQQFNLIKNFAQKIVDIAKAYPQKDIVITADHGMSRMAALGFHNLESITPPAKAQVKNLGRYCELACSSESQDSFFPNTSLDGNILALETHQRFTSSGNAPGEIHGGATPEELYVPIIKYEMSDAKQKSPALTYIIKSNEVYRESDGSVCVEIKTTGNVQSVKIAINGCEFGGKQTSANLWTVRIPGLETEKTYAVQVFINNRYPVSSDKIIVKRRGMIMNDDF